MMAPSMNALRGKWRHLVVEAGTGGGWSALTSNTPFASKVHACQVLVTSPE